MNKILERVLNNQHWKIWAALIISVVSFLLSAPEYHPELTVNGVARGQIEAYEQKRIAPLTIFKYEVMSHVSQTELRLTIPIAAKLLQTKVTTFIKIMPFLLPLFLYLLSVWHEKVGISKLANIGLIFCYATCYVGRSFFDDLYAFFDSYSYLLLLILVFTKNRWTYFPIILMLLFLDERNFLLAGIVAGFKIFEKEGPIVSLKKALNDRDFQIICMSVLAVGLVRLYIMSEYGLGQHVGDARTVNFMIFKIHLAIFRFGMATALEGLWLIVIALLLFALKKGAFPFKIFSMYTLLSIVLCLTVYDFSRTFAYMFPLAMLGTLLIWKNQQYRSYFSHLVCAVVCASVIIPGADVYGNFVRYYVPAVTHTFWHNLYLLLFT